MRKLSYGWKLLRELGQFARQNKVYWIVPLIIVLLLAAIVVFGSQSAAPFIYTLY
jgi:hypothetical protein